MQKIKGIVFERMLGARLTRAEMDLILYLSHYQDDLGRVIGIYYKDVCSALGIACQTFYDVLRRLTVKGLIAVNRECYGDFDVTIRDNACQGRSGLYISTGDDLYFDSKFQELKAGEKLLAMEFLKITKNPENGRKYRKDAAALQEKYCHILGITRRVLLRYLQKLKQFFDIRLHGGQYDIRPLAGVGKKEEDHRDKELYQQHVGKAVMRRVRAVYSEETFRHAVGLIGQHVKIFEENAAHAFAQAVEESIRLRNVGKRNRYRWNREVKPSLIHKILLEKILPMHLAGRKSR